VISIVANLDREQTKLYDHVRDLQNRLTELAIDVSHLPVGTLPPHSGTDGGRILTHLRYRLNCWWIRFDVITL
jgi:hypothetical protein